MRSIPEPEWSPTDAGFVLALAAIEMTTCEGCGGDLHETLDSEAEDWQCDPPLRCARCTRIAIEQDEYIKDGTKHIHALRWPARLIRKPGDTRWLTAP